MPNDDAAGSAADQRLQHLGLGLRTARLEHGLTMRDVASATGVSQPFLSQIERGQAAPSLTTLFTLAELYQATPESLLAVDAAHAVDVTRSTDTPSYRVTDDAHSASRRVLVDGSTMTVSEYVAETGAELGGFYESKGLEFITVLEGRLIVEIDGEPSHQLGSGDSIRYPSRLKHRWRQHGPHRTRFVHVITGQEG